MPIPHDYHMHSRFSEDGEDSPEAMCRQAVERGLPEIGFSEHWDVGPYEQRPRFFQPEPWYAELTRLRALYAGRLTIRAGIEVAEPHLYGREMAEVLKRAEFDYVIGSVHFDGPHFLFDEGYFRTGKADDIYRSYFAELERMVRAADIDIVAHLDVPARAGKPILGYEPARYEAEIRTVLAAVIARRLALDVNAGGLRKPARILMPDPLILKWYGQMGGTRVTLGSDAHRASQVGQHLDQALQAVQAAGLEAVLRFERRASSPVPLADFVV
jgi:histidinol-phosphatase (PHP family)